MLPGVVKFDPKTGQQFKTKSSTLAYTQYFAESLIKEAEVDNKIGAIHAAMGGGTGLNYFQKKFPNHCFDVGIAEQSTHRSCKLGTEPESILGRGQAAKAEIINIFK